MGMAKIKQPFCGLLRTLCSVMVFAMTMLVPLQVMAQEVNAPEVEDSILMVPEGTLLVLPPASENLTEPVIRLVPRKSFLLPESHYDEAVTKAKQLPICLEGLDTCTNVALEWQGRVGNALQSCSEQFDTDEELVEGFAIQIHDLEVSLLESNEKARKNARMAGIGWAIVGGFVAAGVFSTIVITAN